MVMVLEAIFPIFPTWLDQHHGTAIVIGVAVVGLIAFGIQTYLTRKDEIEAKESDREIRDVLLRLEARLPRSVEPIPVVSAVSQNTKEVPRPQLSASDPRIYVDIQDDRKNIENWRTPFLLRNEGGSTAHNVQIQPIKSGQYTTKFPIVGTIAQAGEKPVDPDTDGLGIIQAHNMAFPLMKVWDSGGEITSELVVPLVIQYADFNGHQIETTADMVFFPIQEMLARKHGKSWPGHERRIFEIRNTTFKRLS
jgi:hypothetical protein